MSVVAIASLLLTCFGCRSAPPAGQNTGPSGQQTLKAVLATWLSDESLSVHHVVRNASMLVRDRYLGQSWPDVAASLQREGMPPISEKTSQYVVVRRYVVHGSARTVSTLPFDCFIELEEDRRGADEAHPGQVRAATAGLTAKVGRPYVDVAAAQPPAPEDIVSQVLLRPDVADTAATFPSLDAIEVTYGPIRDRWSNAVPSGFHVRLDFSIDGSEKIAGRRVLFVVESGLDPPQTWDGVPVLEGFSPQDTLGDARSLRAVEWWHGDAATVKANKAKYLGKQ